MNILITGGHSGIGFELSKKILEEGHKIGLIVRNERRKKEVVELFTADNKPDIFIADLSHRDEINLVVQEIINHWEQIDGLFNNAGVLLDKLHFSNYGNELQLEINAISPYLLTKSLKPLFDKATAPFIINTATAGLGKKKLISVENLKQPEKFTKLFGPYLDSKLALVLMMNYLSKQWTHTRIVSVDPGAIKTKMTAGHGMPFWLKPIRNIFFKSPKKGAQNLYDAAFGNKPKGSGIYVSKGKVHRMKSEISELEISQLLAD